MSKDHTIDAIRYALRFGTRAKMTLRDAIIAYLYTKDKPLDVKFHRGYATYNFYEDKLTIECVKSIEVLKKHPVIYWIVKKL